MKYLSLFLLIFLLAGCSVKHERYRTEFFGLFDTVTVIIGYAESEDEFTGYSNIIYERMDELNKLYDIYNEYDGINNLFTVNKNAGIAPVSVDRDIIDMLLFAKEGCNLSGGTVNMAMGPVLKLWHDYRESGTNFPEYAELPPRELLNKAYENTAIEDVIIDTDNNTVFFKKPGMSLDVGALAKAYAEGLAVKAAKDAGMESVIVSAGGNVTTVGKPLEEGRERWSVGVQNPELSISGAQNTLDTVYFNDKTMSISGGYQRYYEVDGKTYNHIIDPATLMPAEHYKQVAVIHADPVMADLLSTALFIMPYEQGKALAESLNGDALWIDNDSNWFYTDGYAAVSNEISGYSSVDLN